MTLITKIKADIKANSFNKKGVVIAVSYRIVNHIYRSSSPFIKVLGFPLVKLYHWTFIWLMGIEIPEDTEIGPGLQVWHGVGLVINHKVVIGNNILLRHCVTIGNNGSSEGVPVIGDNVKIGANSVLIGDIRIGDNVTIGAGAVVTKSIPDNCTAYGNPAKYKFKS